jgi:hypothetical protein
MITLDKNHLDQFEDIAPPMCNALTIPVEGLRGVVIYVCASPFTGRTSKDTIRRIAEALRLDEADMAVLEARR